MLLIISFQVAASVAALLMLIWLGLVVWYLLWAIHRYNENFGFTDEEWKILYPDLYADEKERDAYKRRHDELLRQQRPSEGEDKTLSDILGEPKENPYQRESFGLPAGTIRGVLALTTMVAFVLVVAVNLVSDVGIENRFSELFTVFEMVVAFYFGSRAVEVLQAKRAEEKQAEAQLEMARQSATSDLPQRFDKTTVADETTPTEPTDDIFILRFSTDIPVEQPAIPSIEARLPNIIIHSTTTAVSTTTDSTPTLSKESPLAVKVLALTAAFETSSGFPECFGTVAGNFDGQGISFGALQWNIGQKSLQPLFQKILDQYPKVIEAAMTNEMLAEFKKMLATTHQDQLVWAKGIQITREMRSGAKRWVIKDDWKNALQTIGKSNEMIELQTKQAETRFIKAVADANDYNLYSERGVALMFDINVQNGKVDKAGAGKKIRQEFDRLSDALDKESREVEQMKIIAKQRSAVSLPQWRADVLSRKMTIADGSGTVHGRRYDLATDYFITLDPFVAT